ncbi:MAG TPA: hypothetical protein DDY38_07830, partial [Firmicutes bacterium]|nr:hypothetical protein [Bacillota bacterium]
GSPAGRLFFVGDTKFFKAVPFLAGRAAAKPAYGFIPAVIAQKHGLFFRHILFTPHVIIPFIF